MFKWPGISKTDTQLLKGVGILLIVLHNLFHAFPYWNIENEFDFKSSRLIYYLDHFKDNLFSFVGLSFAYFGHYGVQIFIFLSAYGLYMSWEKKKENYFEYLKVRIGRLYPTFIMAALLFLLLHLVVSGSYNFQHLLFSVFLKLTFTSNFFPYESFSPCGPWWFYSMIVQFYLIFPLLYKLFNRFGHIPFLISSGCIWILEFYFNNALISSGLYFNTLVIGHIPVIYLGMAATKLHKNQPIGSWVVLAAVLLFCLANKYPLFWFFSNAAAVILLLYLYFFIKRLPFKKGVIKRMLLFYGTISMYLFAVNGFLRHPFILATHRTDDLWLKGGVVVGFVVFVTIVATVFWKVESRLFNKIRIGFTNRKTIQNRQSR